MHKQSVQRLYCAKYRRRRLSSSRVGPIHLCPIVACCGNYFNVCRSARIFYDMPVLGAQKVKFTLLKFSKVRILECFNLHVKMRKAGSCIV